MHHSLELLRISEDESELRRPWRLWRLYWSKRRGMIFLAALFLFFAVVAAYAAVDITMLEPERTGQPLQLRDQLGIWAMMGVFAAGFATPGAIFAWLVLRDPIPRWIWNPNRYEVVPAKIAKAERVGGTSGKRSNVRIRVTIRLDDGAGRERLEESFSPSIWCFEPRGGNAAGERPKLPLAAFVIRPRDGRGPCALVGISAASVDPALELLRAANRRRLRSLLLLLALGAAGSAIVLSYRGYF